MAAGPLFIRIEGFYENNYRVLWQGSVCPTESERLALVRLLESMHKYPVSIRKEPAPSKGPGNFTTRHSPSTTKPIAKKQKRLKKLWLAMKKLGRFK